MRPIPALLAVAAVLAFALAGCSSPRDAQQGKGGRGGPPGSTTLAFTEPVAIGGGATGETFVAVGPDGLVLACTHGGFTGPSPTWVSRDGGATWASLVTGALLPSGDCDVEVAQDGDWFVLYDTAWGSALAVSHDDGVTWVQRPDIALPITGVVDRPWIGVIGGRLLLVYKGIGQGPGIIAASTSDDDGATWSTPQVVSLADDPTLANHIGFDFLVGADGVVRIPLVKYDNDPTVDEPFSFLVSRDRGTSWTEEPALPPRDADVLVGAAVAGDGTTLYWAWHDDAGRLLAAASTDDGRTWSDPALVAQGGFVFTPALAGRPDGTATLAWVQGGPYQAAAARLDARADGLVLATAVLESSATTAQMAEFLDVAHDEEGRAIVVYAWEPGDGSCDDLRHPSNHACLHTVRET